MMSDARGAGTTGSHHEALLQERLAQEGDFVWHGE